MVAIHTTYQGELRCSSTHEPSGRVLETDAPVDNHGRGESFSPTDLVATALGTCMLTVMGILANKRGWELGQTRVQVNKHMTQQGPRRIERLEVAFQIPSEIANELSQDARDALEQAAHTCPVRLSLLPALEVPVSFSWGVGER